ncbi:MAG: methyl-accepting chemotaxis protein, partial [Synergistaceae bacterium]|nr:methyl-accepting chemotaxis protein [Synergistaceae bacterium]
KMVNVVTEQIQSIAAAMEEQSASAEEMTAGMDSASRSSLEISEQVGGIALSMNEQSKALSSITASSEELVRLSEAMEHSVSLFRMKEEEPLGLMPSKQAKKS